MIEAAPSAPTEPFGGVVPFVHAEGQRAGLPMNAYLMSRPLMVALVCHPQYCVQKPDVSFTSAPVSTKYMPFVSVGLPAATIVWISASLRLVPRLPLSDRAPL